ncbi:MAG TPA: prepilin-type N-terminal cleavage/methylation domain-containing protein [Tepidisphaeraceae bacterium]|jgi:prepilin-type N-terminal cleavage/methylation domain-containing protein/prepilin-type processing-associated H-X9-DG protein|nr:prepilin-type N-terminal cleavage/methylation domain-containing protein [Tepidisphaeraceae bacterium]
MASPSAKTPRRAFTLVELLVVIGIIAVLVSLLIPVVQAARRMAQAAGCAANLRVIGVAVNGFCADNNGVFPTTVGAGTRADNWVFWQSGRNFNQSAIAPYLASTNGNLKSVFICPAQPIEDQVGFAGGGHYPLTYSMNVSVSSYYPLQLRRVQNPQQKVLVYDENQNADDDQFWYGTDRDTLAGRHGAADYQAANINGTGDLHYERAMGNVLLLDGHVNLVDNNYCHQAVYNDLLQP